MLNTLKSVRSEAFARALLAFPAARQERHRLRFLFRQTGKRVAAALNCELPGSKVVTIGELRGDLRKIVGTAQLENNRENILEFRKDANRLR